MKVCMKVLNRFWNKVDKTGDCWEWKGYKGTHGYGQFSLNDKMVRTHRLAWELTNGPIPPGMCVCHKCDNKACCNPDHLFLGTQQDNMSDMKNKGRSFKPKGTTNGYAKLNEQQVLDIRAEYANGNITYQKLAKKYGVGQSQIMRIVNRKLWSHI